MPPAWERTRGHDLRARAPPRALAGAIISHSAELVRGDFTSALEHPLIRSFGPPSPIALEARLRHDGEKGHIASLWDTQRSPASGDDRVEADAAEAGELHGGAADVDAGDEAEHVDLDALDPADRQPEQALDGELQAGAARRAPDIEGLVAPVLADRGRRQGDARLGDRRQHVGHERIGVGA